MHCIYRSLPRTNEVRDELVESDVPIAFAPSGPILLPNGMKCDYNPKTMSYIIITTQVQGSERWIVTKWCPNCLCTFWSHIVRKWNEMWYQYHVMCYIHNSGPMKWEMNCYKVMPQLPLHLLVQYCYQMDWIVILIMNIISCVIITSQIQWSERWINRK